MRRISTLLCLALIASALSPRHAAAGGNEFPAGGTRNLGRGGSGFTRADDPTVLLRNPALLADLWQDMAYSGLHVLLPDACFQATGSYGWGDREIDNADFGDGQILVGAKKGFTDAEGNPLPDVYDEPFPRVCYSGPTPTLPNIALSMKLAPGVGVGLGFFPPDIAALPQWGNRDGTVNTDNGLRPSPTRWFRAHQNTSYFSALGGLGWRVSDWLTIGAGFQWALVVYSATEFTLFDRNRTKSTNIRADVVGRDLFIPGFVASAQATPIDNLDIALGFKWSDRIKSNARIDITTADFASGMPAEYVAPDSDGMPTSVGSYVRTRNDNRSGSVNAPPIWVPQLSFGIRYADRLVPRTPLSKWESAHKAAGRTVEDHMQTERWDLEFDAIVYLNWANTVSRFYTDNTKLNMDSIDAMGNLAEPVAAYIGQCVKDVKNQADCPQRVVPTYMHGKTQYSLRLGSDYNILPGVLSVRAGVSYETNGQDPRYLNITNYMLGRTGLHVGATWRIAKKTDLSIAYVHFIQRRVSLTVNDSMKFVTDQPGKYHVVSGPADGMAGFPIADGFDNKEGPQFANAGTFYYHLDVVSVALAQHF